MRIEFDASQGDMWSKAVPGLEGGDSRSRHPDGMTRYSSQLAATFVFAYSRFAQYCNYSCLVSKDFCVRQLVVCRNEAVPIQVSRLSAHISLGGFENCPRVWAQFPSTD